MAALDIEADAVNEDEARANRDRYHWSEVDLGNPGGWLKDWITLNLDEQVLYETHEYKVRLQNAYKDTGECLLHARKGRVFATYNVDLMVKWYAVHRLAGRVVGEARGRFAVKDFSSEHVDEAGAARDGAAGAEYVNEGEWEFKKPGVSGQGADEMKKQNPGLEEKTADISDAEAHLKKVVGDVALEPLKARLAHLHAQLAGLARAKERAASKNESVADPAKVPELECDISLRAAAATAKMVRDIKAKMRSPKFEPAVAEIENRTIRIADLRCLSLSDDDTPAILAALPPKGFAPTESEVALETLDLSYNELTDAGVQELMFGLAAGKAPHLTKLNLRNTKLTDLGKRQLAGLKMLRKALAVQLDDAE